MSRQRILITGGAGFIGSNMAHHLISQGHEVCVYDNLSRRGAEGNLAWLWEEHGRASFQFEKADTRDFPSLLQAARGVDRIYHMAGQVAVTTSVADPRRDFEENALGTFNALEAARFCGSDPIFLYSSTNKVYGGMEEVACCEEETRYRFADKSFGIAETQPLDFHSPYGCSKGSGDQYTRDYARIYGLRTIVVRQSCIYGYRQCGMEDQGWLAWFIYAALSGRPITIFGNGKQVRDVLFIEDLISFYDTAVENIERTAGQVFNVGGGPQNTISVWAEFQPLLEELLGFPIPVDYRNRRPGDQPVYISDIRKARQTLGWEPKISVREGIALLVAWIKEKQLQAYPAT
jgi:CDP-paratose 2-epimerase